MVRDDVLLRRIGAIAAIAIAVGYIVTIPLYTAAGAPPSGGGEAWLRYLQSKTALWSAITALSVLTDILYLPVAMALFALLGSVRRVVMLIATSLVGLFVVLDLAVTWTSYAALIALSGDYANAKTDALRTAVIGGSSYPAAVLGSRLEAVYAIGLLSLAILLIGVAMRRSVFGKVPAYLGIVTGGLGVLAVSGFGPLVILTSILTLIWLLVTGYRLLRPARAAT